MYCDEEKINALCGEQVVFEVDPAVVIPHDIREALSRYVCKFPLEWNASLYTLCSKGNCVDCESPLQCECFPLRFKKHIDAMQLGDMIIAFESKYLMSDYLGENDIPLGNASKITTTETISQQGCYVISYANAKRYIQLLKNKNHNASENELSDPIKINNMKAIFDSDNGKMMRDTSMNMVFGEYKVKWDYWTRERSKYIHDKDLDIITDSEYITKSSFSQMIILYHSDDGEIWFDGKNETSDIHKIISEKLFLNGGLLKRQKFKQESVSDPYHKLIVEPQKLSADKWAFWIKGHNGKIIDGKIILQGKITLDIYEENPYLNEYTAPESAVAVTNRLLRFEKEMSDSLGYIKGDAEKKEVLFKHFRYDGKNVCIKAETIKNYQKTEIDWNDFFTIKMETENSIQSDDLFCDIGELIQELDVEHKDGRVTAAELQKAFKDKAKAEKLRRLICNFPFEFRKELFSNEAYKTGLRRLGFDDGEESLQRIQTIAEQIDVWDTIKDIKGIENSEKLWHAHPIYFLDVFDRLGLLMPQNPIRQIEITKDNYPDLYKAYKNIFDAIYKWGCAFRSYQCVAEHKTGSSLFIEEIIDSVIQFKKSGIIDNDMEVQLDGSTKIMNDAFRRLNSDITTKVDRYVEKDKAPSASYYKERRGQGNLQHHVLLDKNMREIFDSFPGARARDPIKVVPIHLIY